MPTGLDRFKEFPLASGVALIVGEEHRFHVKSRTRSEMAHLVDLEEYGGNGACSCEHFNFRVLPKLYEDRQRRLPPRPRRCWHINQALIFYGDLCARVIRRNKQPAHVVNPDVGVPWGASSNYELRR